MRQTETPCRCVKGCTRVGAGSQKRECLAAAPGFQRIDLGDQLVTALDGVLRRVIHLVQPVV